MRHVYKFGGSSLKNAAGIRNLRQIVAHADPMLVVVVSALGKTTNALEAVARAYYRTDAAWRERLDGVQAFHRAVASDLLPDPDDFMDGVLNPSFAAFRRQLDDPPGGTFDFVYDRIVSMGEIWSTLLVHHYLTATGLDFRFVDIRKYLMTDDSYREGRVDWQRSEPLIRRGFAATGTENFITQGFIAGTGKGPSTTLGREGSDFTAAILANVLDAGQVIIWKDVPGVMNADPADVPHTEKLDTLSYREAIELAFFGAKVIHPKTIKPLHSKNIPLWVKSYKEPDGRGTLIDRFERSTAPVPVFVRKRDQVLISISPRDLSFVIDQGLGRIFSRVDGERVKVNLILNSAVSMSLCVDRFNGRVEGLIAVLAEDFTVRYNTDVELITIRHYTDASIREMVSGKTVLFEQKTRSTVNFVVKGNSQTAPDPQAPAPPAPGIRPS